MVIDYLLLKNFGKFNNKGITLNEGINVIYGKNEAGKSTVYNFIQGMLFGIEKKRGRGSDTDLYTRYEPWENSMYYEGLMQISTGGCKYIITRKFNKINKEVKIFNATDNKEVDNSQYREILGGLTKENYNSTLAFTEYENLSLEDLSYTLSNYVTNLNMSRTKNVDVKKAISKLNKEKKHFKNAIEKLDIEGDEKLLERIDELILDTPYKEDYEILSRKVIKSRAPRFIWLFIMLVFIVAAIVTKQYLLLAGVAISLISLIIELWPKFEYEENYGEVDNDGRIELVNEKEKIMDSLELKTLKKKEYEKEISSIDLAIDTINSISTSIFSTFGEDLNELSSEYIALLTKGEYNKLKVDEDMKITVYKDNRMVNVNMLSYSAIKQIFLAIRIACARLLFNEEKMPIILDEPFAHYDNEKTLETLLSLGKLNASQIIIFACTDREVNYLRESGVAFNLIKL